MSKPLKYIIAIYCIIAYGYSEYLLFHVERPALIHKIGDTIANGLLIWSMLLTIQHLIHNSCSLTVRRLRWFCVGMLAGYLFWDVVNYSSWIHHIDKTIIFYMITNIIYILLSITLNSPHFVERLSTPKAKYMEMLNSLFLAVIGGILFNLI